MGGEPTFVSVDDMTSPQWTVAADGPEKRALANQLAAALADRFAKGGLVQRSQGKWYPGEDQPRWQIGLVWRADGEPLWSDPALLADPFDGVRGRGGRARPGGGAGPGRDRRPRSAGRPAASLLSRTRWPDCWPRSSDRTGRGRTSIPRRPPRTWSRELDQAETGPVAWALPLVPSWFGEGWASPDWRTRRDRLVLVPGELPAGMRLPLSSLSWRDPDYAGEASYARAGAGPGPSRPSPPKAVVVDAGRDRGPDRPGGAGAGRLRVRLPAAAGEAGDVRRAAGRTGPGRRARPGHRSCWKATARPPIPGSSTC